MSCTSLSASYLAFFPFVVCAQLGAQQTAGTPPPPPKSQAAELPKEPLPAPVTVKPLTGKGILFQLGESTLKLGGYVKVDLMHDFDRISSTDFDPRTIDTTGLDGENTFMTARESRINLDLRTPTDLGELKTYVEGDFAGSSNSFRLRHAYGSVDHYLGGQTWSTFMDEDAMPSTLDFESPIAFPISRVAQFRFTQNYEGGNYFAVALENPNNSLDAPTGVPGITQNPAPDLTARIRMNNDRGHVQLGMFGGMASFQPDTGSSDDVALWGLNLSAKETTWGKDYAIVQLTYGDGVGGFRGGIAAAPDSSGDLEAVTTSAYMAGYQHYWSEKYRSTLVYSAAEGDLPSGAAPDANEKVSYLAANLIWQFCNRAWVGIEYLHGTRDTFADGDGAADRLQLSMRFDF
jgi:hypothetical protein